MGNRFDHAGAERIKRSRGLKRAVHLGGQIPEHLLR
jgi:hypothetical protein